MPDIEHHSRAQTDVITKEVRLIEFGDTVARLTIEVERTRPNYPNNLPYFDLVVRHFEGACKHLFHMWGMEYETSTEWRIKDEPLAPVLFVNDTSSAIGGTHAGKRKPIRRNEGVEQENNLPRNEQ